MTYLREQGSSLGKITVGEEYDEEQDEVCMPLVSRYPVKRSFFILIRGSQAFVDPEQIHLVGYQVETVRIAGDPTNSGLGSQGIYQGTLPYQLWSGRSSCSSHVSLLQHELAQLADERWLTQNEL